MLIGTAPKLCRFFFFFFATSYGLNEISLARVNMYLFTVRAGAVLWIPLLQTPHSLPGHCLHSELKESFSFLL